MNNEGGRPSKREPRLPETEEDRALLEAAQRGDPAAFRALVERHERRAHAVALGLVRDENDAREVVQEAFLRVHKGLASFERGSSFYTWLFRIVTNVAIDLMRKPGRQLASDRPLDEATIETSTHGGMLVARVDGADPLEALHRTQLATRLRAALDALPPYHRGVIVMREIDGMSYEEMAEAMGVSKGTIMSRLFHARQKLQRALAELYEETQGRPPPRRGEGEP